MRRRSVSGLLVGCVAALACGCSGGADSTKKSSFTLATVEQSLTVAAGGQTDLHIVVTRSGGLDGDITIGLTTPPAGVSAEALLPARATTGALVVVAADDAAPTSTTVSLIAADNAGKARASLDVPLTIRGRSGTVDAAFGSGGGLLLGDTKDFAAVTVDSTGAVLVAGSGFVPTQRASVLRVTADGTLDASFGTDGVTSLDFGVSNYEGFYDVALDEQGRVVATGYAYTGGTGDAALIARLDPQGHPDASFAGDGSLTVTLRLGFLTGGNELGCGR